MEFLTGLFSGNFNTEFFVSLISIIIIDLVLAGDNSIVIAMAVQSLPPKQRFKGIIAGALAAVLLRVFFTFCASKMLVLPFIKLIGGALILWIAVKLMCNNDGEHTLNKKANGVWNAVWMIMVADITMSLDNILAVAGASHGSLPLLLFGLGLSIPLVVFASTLISKLMDRFPAVMWIGAIVLGKVGGEMMMTDPFIVQNVLVKLHLTEMKGAVLHANHYLVWTAEIIGAIGVALVAIMLRRRTQKAAVEPNEAVL